MSNYTEEQNYDDGTRIEVDPNEYLNTKIGYFNKDPSIATLYVGNLNFDKTERDIKKLFRTYGEVNYVKLIKDSKTHKSKGIAFVQMPNGKEARKAISELHKSDYEGRLIRVSYAIENDKDRVKKPKKVRRKPYKAYVSKADRGIPTA